MPGGGMTGPRFDKDGYAGALPAPACPGHRGHSGGGKPPPPMVHPMRHAGPQEGTEGQAPCHSSVRQGSRAEEAAASVGGAEGDLGEGVQGILGSAGECNGVSIPGTGVDAGRR